ncbi:HAD family phosphatase [Antrihabitans cavernicola]|uniref:HAD family phosphatase n=2 Tax=Antrihabitans cavernicola TaxID=2495913 RepID=A0A5A7SC62_9NOCA|nr:HAD family phosphatase [Spelaeibacter cavernicola]KAA0023718.1 HAD family phosphatase [Spelaeibacter cavernicola]
MDGTLLDSEKLWDVAVYELAEHLGGEMTTAIRHSLIGSSGPNALKIIFEAFDLQPYPAALDDAGRWLEKRVTELFENGIPWRPGAKDALAMVRDSGLSTALVTNTKRSLTEYGLDTIGREYFDVTVCGDEVDNGKPAADPYLRAVRLLGLAAQACLAIEDSPTGTLSAEAAGCSVLIVPCEIAVPDGPGRAFRESLVGLELAHLHEAMR